MPSFILVMVKLLLVLIFAMIFYQDTKERQVYWFLFPMAALCCASLNWYETLPELFLVSVLMNGIFTTVIICTTFIYIKLRLSMKINKVLGIGDLLLFYALIFSFASISFMVIVVASLVFSLALHLLLNLKKNSLTVPLAGYMSLFFAMTYIAFWFGITDVLYTL